MTEEDALLAAVLAAPDDDTPRLVYADWLDDHGQPHRAEFIRLECRLAAGDCSNNPTDAERAFELEVRHANEWLACLPKGSQVEGAHVEWSFRRGFPERVAASVELFLDRYYRFVAVQWLRALCLNAFGSSAAIEFADRVWSPRWVELELVAPFIWRNPSPQNDATAVIRAIANCPQARQLRSLRFVSFELSAAAVDSLASSPHLDGLQVLVVPGERNRPLFTPLLDRFGPRLSGDRE